MKQNIEVYWSSPCHNNNLKEIYITVQSCCYIKFVYTNSSKTQLLCVIQ
jgi:hypothetical protein